MTNLDLAASYLLKAQKRLIDEARFLVGLSEKIIPESEKEN